MELFILTGASRGLGRALAEQLLGSDHTLLTIARKPDATLEKDTRGARLEQWSCDLADAPAAAARLEEWLRKQESHMHTRVTLINNAGLLSRIGPIDLDTFAALSDVLRVGLEAPLLLTAAFLRATRDWRGERRVLNISTGASRTAITGWAGYCAAKAGLDHFSRVVALDEAGRPNPAKIVSLAPGVIDTDMQAQLRMADAGGFPDQQRFLDLKASGELASAEEAARRVLAFLRRADFGTKPTADVRDP